MGYYCRAIYRISVHYYCLHNLINSGKWMYKQIIAWWKHKSVWKLQSMKVIFLKFCTWPVMYSIHLYCIVLWVIVGYVQTKMLFVIYLSYCFIFFEHLFFFYYSFLYLYVRRMSIMDSWWTVICFVFFPPFCPWLSCHGTPCRMELWPWRWFVFNVADYCWYCLPGFDAILMIV